MTYSRFVRVPFGLTFGKLANGVWSISTWNSGLACTRSYSNCYPKYAAKMYTVDERGSPNAPNYRLYIKDANGPVSLLHDIPLWANKEKKILNMIVEVPRWTNAKMEISLKDPLNPIKQDVKKGNLRYVANCFPHHGYIWNYGALPQTWENPQHIDPNTQCKGDNDPIDICEIGARVPKRGEVVQVKVLGTIALIDEGETDWKLLAIDVNDPTADLMNDVNDIETHYPGLLKATVEWFKIYKIPDGKPENQFAFNAEAKNAEFAYRIIDEVHQFWQSLIKNEADIGGINCTNVSQEDSLSKIHISDAADILEKNPPFGLPADIPVTVHKWHYVSLQ